MADKSKTLLYEDPYCDDEDEAMGRRISQVAFVAYQQAKMKGLPVARYDAEKKATYLLDLRRKIMYNGSRNLQKRKDD